MARSCFSFSSFFSCSYSAFVPFSFIYNTVTNCWHFSNNISVELSMHGMYITNWQDIWFFYVSIINPSIKPSELIQTPSSKSWKKLMCLFSPMRLTDDVPLEAKSIDGISVTSVSHSVRFLFRDLSRSRSVRASDSYKIKIYKIQLVFMYDWLTNH